MWRLSRGAGGRGGPLKNGYIRHGEGTYTHTNGGKYVGQFKDGKVQGFGTIFFADGTVKYQGEWANGKPVHGPDLS